MRNEENHARACDFIRSAASQGCDLAVLPEYHLDGWNPTDGAWLAHCAQFKQYLDSYCALAKELAMCIVPGTIVETHSAASTELINVAHFISHDGTILASYRKKNLWHTERPYLTSSWRDPHEAFETPIGKCGMLVCWDLAFPEAFRGLIAGGAKIIIIPAFWMHGDCGPRGLVHNPQAESLFIESPIV
jgi:predicted amidohydrolase